MIPNQSALLKDRRFLPLFIAQFFGAFHDNLFKNALVALLLYGVSLQVEGDPKLWVTFAGAVFIFPYLIFSAMGGQLADKYPKNIVIRWIKLAEIGIALGGIAALFTGEVWLCFAVLFALGTQSAFFAPSKYSILPDHLKENELIGGNALINTGTFLAILIGTLLGTLLIVMGEGKLIVSGVILASAGIGYFASRFIPTTVPLAPDLKIDWNPAKETFAIIRNVFVQQKLVLTSILGASWFYLMGSMFMTQFANYTKEVLQADETVLAFFLFIFSVGVGIGGLLNNRILGGKVSPKFVPLALIGMSLFSVDLYLASPSHIQGNVLFTLSEFLSVFSNWRIILDILFVAVCGGLYVVPLNAIIQHHSKAAERARVIAGSAILDSLFITASMLICMGLIMLGLDVHELFLAFAGLNLLAVLYMRGIKFL